MRSQVLILSAVAALTLSGCGSSVAGGAVTGGDLRLGTVAAGPAAGHDALFAKAIRAVACARLRTIQPELVQIQSQVFRAMSASSDSAVWASGVMDLDRKKAPLITDRTAQKVLCAGGDQGAGTSGGVATEWAATTKAGGASPLRIKQTQVAVQMEKISANPLDTFALQELADSYFEANDFKNAAVWAQKVVDIDPTDSVGLLSLGSVNHNLGNMAEAEDLWLVAEFLHPENLEVHYDLGYLYQNETPPYTEGMKAEWGRIVELDATSDLAKTVAPYLK